MPERNYEQELREYLFDVERKQRAMVAAINDHAEAVENYKHFKKEWAPKAA